MENMVLFFFCLKIDLSLVTKADMGYPPDT